MSNFKCLNCGECCGPIPLTNVNIKQIKDAVQKLNPELRHHLKKQKRGKLDCILLDKENKLCSIHENRVTVCRQFGQVRELECPNNKGLNALREGKKEIVILPGEKVIGILGLTIGLDELEG